MGYKMKLYFKPNPYFTNMVIVKEFQCNQSGKRQSPGQIHGTPTYPCPVPSPQPPFSPGRLVSHSTPIHWHRGQEPQAYKERNQDTDYNFFSWFSNQSLPEADRIAEVGSLLGRPCWACLYVPGVASGACIHSSVLSFFPSLSTDYQE